MNALNVETSLFTMTMDLECRYAKNVKLHSKISLSHLVALRQSPKLVDNSRFSYYQEKMRALHSQITFTKRARAQARYQITRHIVRLLKDLVHFVSFSNHLVNFQPYALPGFSACDILMLYLH